MLNRLSGRRSQTGQGQTEYILIAALIVVVLIVAYGSFGDKVREQVAYQTSEIAGTSDEKKGGASGSSQYSSKNPTSNDGKEGKDTPGGGAGVGAGTGSGGSSGGGSGGTGGQSPPAPEPSVWTRTCYGMQQGMITI